MPRNTKFPYVPLPNVSGVEMQSYGENRGKSPQQPMCHPRHLEALRSGIFWFAELSPGFSIDQKSSCWDFNTGNASEMLSFLFQREQLNDGADPILVTWDFAQPETWFSRSTIIIYAAPAKGNTDQCP